MPYEIILNKNSENFLKKLDKKNKDRIIEKIEKLSENPELGKPLTGKLSGLWSLRTGDYRAIYQIKNNEFLILVIQIGHRKNIYS